ncbi:MAG TPA: hypothetical protein PLU93_11690 [Treponemataceae bacterium]|nr:hypothetical protein [Treponemataceae bacterium]
MLTNTEAKRLDNSNPEFERVSAFEDISAEVNAAPAIFSYTIKTNATSGLTALTAPFALVVRDIQFLTTVGETNNTIQVLNGSTQVCTALVATTAKAITRMVAGVEIDKLTLDAGDTLSVKAAGGSNGDDQRGVITFYCEKV